MGPLLQLTVPDERDPDVEERTSLSAFISNTFIYIPVLLYTDLNGGWKTGCGGLNLAVKDIDLAWGGGIDIMKMALVWRIETLVLNIETLQWKI